MLNELLAVVVAISFQVDSQDGWTWAGSDDGCYSVRSAYAFALAVEPDEFFKLFWQHNLVPARGGNRPGQALAKQARPIFKICGLSLAY